MERILEDISKWSVEKRKARLEKIYMDRIGVPINWEHPERFTEKIQWRKLFEHNKIVSRCVDKLSFKQYVREKIGDGWTTPLIDVWHSPADVRIGAVPTPCVLKSNCASDGKYVYIIKDEKELDLTEVETEIKRYCFDRRYLHTNSFFSAYYSVNPCVIVEDYLSEVETGIDEYKFFCFDGEPKYVYHSDNHFKDNKNSNYTVSFFDMQWNFLGIQYGTHVANPNAPKPKYMSDMTRICRTLSKDFSFVRVDFFGTSSRFYVSEMTFAPGAGLTPYNPASFDYEMGSLWKLDTSNMNVSGNQL